MESGMSSGVWGFRPWKLGGVIRVRVGLRVRVDMGYPVRVRRIRSVNSIGEETGGGLWQKLRSGEDNSTRAVLVTCLVRAHLSGGKNIQTLSCTTEDASYRGLGLVCNAIIDPVNLSGTVGLLIQLS